MILVVLAEWPVRHPQLLYILATPHAAVQPEQQPEQQPDWKSGGLKVPLLAVHISNMSEFYRSLGDDNTVPLFALM